MRIRRTTSALLVLGTVVSMLGLGLASAYAADGDLDTTFGAGGIVTTSIGTVDDVANIIAIQSDGKIAAAGRAYDGSQHDFMLARYNTDGSLDTTFDGDGKVTTDFGASHDIISDMAFQSDGKIVVAGYSLGVPDWDFALARYNTDGSLDTTFDGDGKVTTDIGGSDDVATGMAIQTNGKIVVAGYSSQGGSFDFALARYSTNGSLDTTFDGDGEVTTDFGPADDAAMDMAIQSDGKIVAAGYSYVGAQRDFALARFNIDGSLDTTFDGDGEVTTAIGSGDDVANSVAIQANGRIVVAGRTGAGGSLLDYALARYNTDGSLDTTFDGDGKVTTDFDSDADSAQGVAIQPNGKIVTAGYSYVGHAEYDFSLARYNTNGSLDTSFDGDGKVTTDVGGSEDASNSVAIQPDGKIVAVGYLWGVSYDLGMVRYDSATHQPDAQIKTSSAASYSGDGTYNLDASGQSVAKKVKPGKIATFGVRIQNDGNADDPATVLGCAKASGLKPTYMDGALSVTTQVVAGTYSTGSLAPGTTKDLTLKVKARKTAAPGASLACLITATSQNEGVTKDAVKATVTVK